MRRVILYRTVLQLRILILYV